MRLPNPPRVYLNELSPEQQRKVILLALEVVHDLALEKDWDAYSKVELSDLTLEERLGFASLLNSRQAAAIASLDTAAHNVK